MFKEVLCFSPWINEEELVQLERFFAFIYSVNYSYTQPCSSSLLRESPCSSGSCGMLEQVQGTAERGLRAAPSCPSWHSLAVRARRPGRRHPDAERPHVQLCLLPSGTTRLLLSWSPANFKMHLVGCKFQIPTSAAGIRNRSDAGN